MCLQNDVATKKRKKEEKKAYQYLGETFLSHTPGNASYLTTTRTKTTYYHRSFTISGLNLHNSLRRQIQTFNFAYSKCSIVFV